jgi:hypothetical protein
MAVIFAVTIMFAILAGKRNKRKQNQEAISVKSF